MKFGRNLPRHQVPEWASHYVDYKDLKKLVSRAASEARERGQEMADLKEFLAHFHRNLDHVDTFYNAKFAAARRRLSILKDRLGDSSEILQADLRELLWALLKMRGDLENLLWYGEVNRKALVRITRSSSVKVPRMRDVFVDLERQVDDKSFAKGAYTAQLLVEVNEWLKELRGASRVEDEGEKEEAAGSVDAKDQAQAAAAVPFAAVREAIRAGDRERLEEVLDEEMVHGVAGDDSVLLRGFLQQAISARSAACTAVLLGRIGSLDEPDEINQRNCLHRLVLQLARTSVKLDAESSRSAEPDESAPAETDPSRPGPPTLKSDQSTLLAAEAADGIEFLRFFLDSLPPALREVLKSKDVFGRMPLHYAVRFGLRDVAEVLVARMEEWHQVDPQQGIDGPEWQDEEGYAPLHLAVVSNYPAIALVLLDGKGVGGDGAEDVRKLPFASGDILILATKLDSAEMIRILLRAGADVNWQDANGETALLVASRLGHVACVEALLQPGRADVDVAEKVFGRTPLHVAAVHGHLHVVELLLDAGADPRRKDEVGWTAKEQAGFRGYSESTAVLAAAEKATLEKAPAENAFEGKHVTSAAVASAAAVVVVAAAAATNTTTTTDHPIDCLPSLAVRKPLCHLTDESVVMISLGSLIPSKKLKPVVLDAMPLTGRNISGFVTALSLEISARNGADAVPVHAATPDHRARIDLPIIESVSTRPELFYTRCPEETAIYFDIVPTYSHEPEPEKIGRAVAALAALLPSVGATRTNLHREVTVPILASNLEIMGTVTFTFQVIRPFAHPRVPPGTRPHWGTPARVMGHRGLGMNHPATRRLQIGENTVASFQAAGELGAHYVEFDVQVSKDGVPIIYHDSVVSESGADAPVWNVTEEQLHHLNSSRRPPPPRTRDGTPDHRPRSRSIGFADPSAVMAEERMRHGRLVQAAGFCANTRARFIQAPFATLAEILRKVPPHVGLDIELKYPDLCEAEAYQFDTYGTELNSYCDVVLRTVFDSFDDPSSASPAPRRPIIFSSFSPSICQHLRFKQSAIPVFFLTTGDGEEVASAPVDVRSSSLQEGISFAKRWGLTGIVSTAKPLVNCPRLIGLVRSQGLVLLSYGVENTRKECVQVQFDHGIDGVITDELVAVLKQLGLRA